MAELKGYELSRDWFDFCFENPELVKPTHTALYFFAIEHCNRLGWKSKFGLPTQMAMDAIGVKNWRTYSKAFDDIVDWGFFKLLEKSKNQYSATVIAIVKNTKASTKALTKAMQKHSQKQSNSIVDIIKPDNQEPDNDPPLSPKGENTWRNDFEIYKNELRSVYSELINDITFIQTQEKFHPGVDIKLSLEKACINFWATEAGWKHKKKKRSKEISWKSTLTNAIDLNKVYKSKETVAAVEIPYRPDKW